VGLSIFDETLPIISIGVWGLGDEGTTQGGLGTSQFTRRVDAIYVSNSDVVSHRVRVSLQDSGLTFDLVETTVIARAGFDGNPSTEVFQSGLGSTLAGVPIQASNLVLITAFDTITVSTEVQAMLVGGYL